MRFNHSNGHFLISQKGHKNQFLILIFFTFLDASIRSHSISVLPSNATDRSSLTFDLCPLPPPQQTPATTVTLQQNDPLELSPEKYHDNSSSGSSSAKNTNHQLNHQHYHYPQPIDDINFTSRQISRDKTEPIAHLDPRSIQSESEAELYSSSNQKAVSSNLNLHLQNPPAQPVVVTSVPTSILRESSFSNALGASSTHGSYYELKQLQQGGAGVRYLPQIPPPTPEKRILFDTGPPPPPPPPAQQFPLQALRRRWSSYQTQVDPNLDPIDGIVALLSAIYCKIIVVIGLCFPMAEVISHRIPISWYEGFYLYLYTGSILFLIFVYIFLLNRKRRQARANRLSRIRNCAARLCRIFSGSGSKKGKKSSKKNKDGEDDGEGDDSRSGSGSEENGNGGGVGDGDDEDDEEEEEPLTQVRKFCFCFLS